MRGGFPVSLIHGFGPFYQWRAAEALSRTYFYQAEYLPKRMELMVELYERAALDEWSACSQEERAYFEKQLRDLKSEITLLSLHPKAVPTNPCEILRAIPQSICDRYMPAEISDPVLYFVEEKT